MGILGTSAPFFEVGSSGGGGFITSVFITNDNKVTCTGDVWGGSDWDEATSRWEQIVRADLMPAGDYGPSKPSSGGKSDFPGCFFYIRANADSTRGYMMWNALLYYRDGSAAWTRSSMTAKKSWTNTGAPRLFNGRAVTNPSDKTKLLFGTMEDVRYTLDGGVDGTFAVSGIGAPVDIGGVASMNLVAVKADGSQWAIFEQGTGAKTSATINGTYTLISGSPTTCRDFFYDAAGHLHVVTYSSEQATNNWQYWNGTTWTRPTMPSGAANYVNTVAVDPVDGGAGVAQTCVGIADSGQLWLTLNKGTTFVGAGTWNLAYPAPIGIFTNAPDFIWKNGSRNVNPSKLLFAPSGSNRLWCAEGVGCRRSTPPGSFSRWDWYDASKAKTGNVGLDMWVCNQVLTIPGNTPGRNYQMKWDAPLWDVADSKIPATYKNPNASSGVSAGWGADYAIDDPTFVACAISMNGDGCGWWDTTTKVYTKFGTKAITQYGGAIAWSDKNRGIIINGGGSSGGTYAEFTRNAGASFSALQFGGETLGQLLGPYYTIRKMVAADKDNPGVFYILISTSNTGSTPSNFSGLWRKTIGLTGAGDAEQRLYAAPLVGSWTDTNGHQPTIRWVPGSTGKILMTAGVYGPSGHPFYIFQDNGSSATRTAVANVTDVAFFGLGKAPRGQSYPSVFIFGNVSGVRGVHWSSDNMATWTKFADYPLNHIDNISSIDGDWNIFGRCYIGYSGSNQIVIDFTKTVTLS